MSVKPKLCEKCGVLFIPTGGRQIVCTECTHIIREEVKRRYRASPKGKQTAHEEYVRYLDSERGQLAQQQRLDNKAAKVKSPTKDQRIDAIKGAFE